MQRGMGVSHGEGWARSSAARRADAGEGSLKHAGCNEGRANFERAIAKSPRVRQPQVCANGSQVRVRREWFGLALQPPSRCKRVPDLREPIDMKCLDTDRAGPGDVGERVVKECDFTDGRIALLQRFEKALRVRLYFAKKVRRKRHVEVLAKTVEALP